MMLSEESHMKEYNKLVRDKIPDIMRSNGAQPIVERIHPDSMQLHLNNKLREEVEEYLTDGNRVEELVDILTVIFAILESKGVSLYDFMRLYSKKLESRGGFRDGLYLLREL